MDTQRRRAEVSEGEGNAQCFSSLAVHLDEPLPCLTERPHGRVKWNNMVLAVECLDSYPVEGDVLQTASLRLGRAETSRVPQVVNELSLVVRIHMAQDAVLQRLLVKDEQTNKKSLHESIIPGNREEQLEDITPDAVTISWIQGENYSSAVTQGQTKVTPETPTAGPIIG